MTKAERKYLLELYIAWTKRNNNIPKRRLEEKMREIVGDEVGDVISYVKNAVHSQNQLAFIKFCDENKIKVVYSDKIPAIRKTDSTTYEFGKVVVRGVSYSLSEFGCNLINDTNHILAL